MNGGDIKVFETDKGNIEVNINFEKETVWLNVYQIAKLFGKDRTTILRHIQNIYSRGEWDKDSTCVKIAQVQEEGGRLVKRDTFIYNLDVILSIGYSTNSPIAIKFRRRASTILKDHLLKGYSINQKRLQEIGMMEFEKVIALVKKNIEFGKLDHKETKGMLDLVTDYAHSWIVLQKYDEGTLSLENLNVKETSGLGYDEAMYAINEMRDELLPKGEVSEMFGVEKHDGLKGILCQVYQTFDKTELYPSIEEKATAILYFVIKNHPFADGNKKIGAFLLLVFLAKNNYLYLENGEKRIDDDILVALTLLVATSESTEKEMVLRLIANFLKK